MTTRQYTAKQLRIEAGFAEVRGDGRITAQMLRQAAEDAERLEFIAYHFHISGLDMGSQHHWAPNGALRRMRGPTFIDALDAAIAQEKTRD